jgi:EpsI family protein
MNRSFRPFALTVLLLAGTFMAVAFTARRLPESLRAPLDSIPPEVAGWSMVKQEQLDPHVLEVLLPSSYLSRTYHKKGLSASLFVAYYAQQRAGESMHSPKNCLPGSGWEIWHYDSASVPVNGRQVTINKYSIQNSGQRSLVFYWYQSRQRIVASEYLGKILLMRDALFDGRTAGSIVRIVLPDVAEASDAGLSFSAAVIPEIERCFGQQLDTISEAVLPRFQSHR